MEEILKTSLLEHEKSAFVIDLVRHDNGKLYLEIIQTIRNEYPGRTRALKINPLLLDDIISVLQTYKSLIPTTEHIKQALEDEAVKIIPIKNLPETKQSAIQSRYLKGVSIPELAMQFGCKEKLIEMILRNNGLAITDNKMPAKQYRRFRKRR